MYSLGCTFFHALTGHVPYDGTTALGVVAKHMTAPIPNVRELRPEVPRNVAAIIERLMAKDADDRYASYDELLSAIDASAPTDAYAGFWARVPASIVDAFVGGVLIGLLGWPALFLYLGYLTVGHHYRGQTLGKYLMQLKVERTDGSSLSLPRSAARTLASMWMPLLFAVVVLFTQGFDTLAGLIERLDARELDAVRSLAVAVVIGNALLSLLYVGGLVLAAFHPQKRAAHDLVVGTHVRYALRGKASPHTLLEAQSDGG
jgi:uncharacterized RDD family membrane protein YckC